MGAARFAAGELLDRTAAEVLGVVGQVGGVELAHPSQDGEATEQAQRLPGAGGQFECGGRARQLQLRLGRSVGVRWRQV